MDWLNTSTIEKAGAIVVAILAMFLCGIIFRGYQKIMTNHLHDSHEDKIKDIESRERNTQVLQKLCDKIDLK